MTPEEVRALSDEALDKTVGWELGGAIGEALGLPMWRPVPGADPEPLPRFSSDWNAMGALIERMQADGYHYEIVTGGATRFSYPGRRGSWRSVGAPNMPRGVAEAAVLARAAQHQEEER